VKPWLDYREERPLALRITGAGQNWESGEKRHEAGQQADNAFGFLKGDALMERDN
jgi:hypothetical protein